MAWKLALNVLYTIGIFVCGAVAWVAYPKQQYFLLIGAVFLAGLLIIFKIKLLKDLKQPKK